MATPSLPTEQFNPKSLYTITGAAAAVWLFGAVLYTVLGDKVDEVVYRGIGFGLSILIAIGMLFEKKKYGVKYWLLVIPNSALIFVNASGYNAVNNGSVDTPGVEKENTAMISTTNTTIQQANFLPFFKDVAWWPDPKLNQKIEQLEKINDSLAIENKTIKNQIGNNTGGAADKQKITFLEDQVKLLQKENEALKTGNNNGDLTTDIAGLKRDLTNKTNLLKTCNSDLQKTKNELLSVTNQLNSCLKNGNSNTALNDKLRNAEAQIATLKKQLADCKNASGDPDGLPLVINLRRKVSDLEKELESLKNQLIKCQGDLKNVPNTGDQSKQIYDLQRTLKTCNKDLEICSSELRKYQGYYKNCSGQLGMVRDSLNRCLNPKQVFKTQIPKGQ